MENGHNKLQLKLLIDKKSNKVLFGEANEDFVDFLLSLLLLPLGTVAMLLTKDNMVGSIGEVYHSLSKLDETYILSNENVSFLLNPRFVSTSSYPKTKIFLPAATNKDSELVRRFYICSNRSHSKSLHLKNTSIDSPVRRLLFGKARHKKYGSFRRTYVSDQVKGATGPQGNDSLNMETQLITKSDGSTGRCCEYVSEVKGATCPRCKTSMNTEAQIVNQPKSVGSSVAEVGSEGVTYFVMDDLTVVPMSKISSITLLHNKFQIKDLASLEEKTVSVSLDEELKLLKASLQSKTVLTDVFLK